MAFEVHVTRNPGVSPILQPIVSTGGSIQFPTFWEAEWAADMLHELGRGIAGYQAVAVEVPAQSREAKKIADETGVHMPDRKEGTIT